MRLWIFSDTHLEMQPVRFPEAAPDGVDVIVDAGDLCAADDFAAWSQWLVERYNVPLIFVPGNHEYYVGQFQSGLGRSFGGDKREMQRVAELSRAWQQRVHVLDDEAVILGGVRFVGGTLWTDFGFDEDPLRSYDDVVRENMRFAPSGMMDYVRIRTLQPRDVLDQHERTRDYLRTVLAAQQDGPTVVVTHHLPHPVVQPPVYRNEYGNAYFTCSARPFGDLLESGRGPDLWICGHSHHHHRARLGRTDLLLNPRGYAHRRDEMANGFFWEFTVDV